MREMEQLQRAACVPIRSQQFSFAPLSLAPRVEVLAMKVDAAAAAGGSVVGNRCADQGLLVLSRIPRCQLPGQLWRFVSSRSPHVAL